EDLEARKVDAFLDEPRRFLPHLAHALAGRVVNVIGRTAAAQIGLPQLVAETPVHVRRGRSATQMRHARHVSVIVVLVGLRLAVHAAGIDRGAAETIVLLAWFDQAALVVIVRAGP